MSSSAPGWLGGCWKDQGKGELLLPLPTGKQRRRDSEHNSVKCKGGDVQHYFKNILSLKHN